MTPAATIRIVGGTRRSRRIAVPPRVRPTLGRVRESLFNRLGQDLDGRRCLDLFAGTGALGLESLSRGAAHASFVDVSAAALRQVRSSASALGFAPGSLRLHRCDAFRWLAGARDHFDVVFADPPYRLSDDDGRWTRLLELIAGVCVESRTVVYCEGGRETPAPTGWAMLHSESAGAGHWRLLVRKPGAG